MKHDFSELRLDHVTRSLRVRRQGVQRVDELTLTACKGEFICPARAIGLRQVDGAQLHRRPPCICRAGSIWLDDLPIPTLPPEQRGFGRVFQNYALFRT